MRFERETGWLLVLDARSSGAACDAAVAMDDQQH